MTPMHCSLPTVLLVLGMSVASVSVGAKEPCPAQVRISFPDMAIAPIYNGNGLNFENPPGYLVEWVKKAVAQTACAPQTVLSRRPFKRGYQELEYGEADLMAVASPTPEHMAIAVFPSYQGQLDPQMAWYRTTLYLWVRKGDTSMQWDGKVLQGPARFKVGVSSGTQHEGIARKHGWEPEVGPNALRTIDKLLVGRMPVALIPDVTVASVPDAMEAKLERLGPPLENSPIYSAASKQFYAQYPEFVAQYWSALCKASRAEKALPEQKRLPACR